MCIRDRAYAADVTCPVLYMMNLDDRFMSRASCLALFDRLGSVDKHLVAYPGDHGENLHRSLEEWGRFFADRLGGRDRGPAARWETGLSTTRPRRSQHVGGSRFEPHLELAGELGGAVPVEHHVALEGDEIAVDAAERGVDEVHRGAGPFDDRVDGLQ